MRCHFLCSQYNVWAPVSCLWFRTPLEKEPSPLMHICIPPTTLRCPVMGMWLWLQQMCSPGVFSLVPYSSTCNTEKEKSQRGKYTFFFLKRVRHCNHISRLNSLLQCVEIRVRKSLSSSISRARIHQLYTLLLPQLCHVTSHDYEHASCPGLHRGWAA